MSFSKLTQNLFLRKQNIICESTDIGEMLNILQRTLFSSQKWKFHYKTKKSFILSDATKTVPWGFSLIGNCWIRSSVFRVVPKTIAKAIEVSFHWRFCNVCPDTKSKILQYLNYFPSSSDSLNFSGNKLVDNDDAERLTKPVPLCFSFPPFASSDTPHF